MPLKPSAVTHHECAVRVWESESGGGGRPPVSSQRKDMFDMYSPLRLNTINEIKKERIFFSLH